MLYKCPKGHQSADSDYCSECGSLIGKSNFDSSFIDVFSSTCPTTDNLINSFDICPDCGTQRDRNSRFCEVCRYDFENKVTDSAEMIASLKVQDDPIPSNSINISNQKCYSISTENIVISKRLNIVISVDKAKAENCKIESLIKPDTEDRIFPLDLDENLIGRHSVSKHIYPDIEINDPGVSHRHLKLIKQSDGTFVVLDLGSANGTELNGVPLNPGVTAFVKLGDELKIGIWTKLKIVSRLSSVTKFQ
ncbi:MAG: FHA domain-containing protein [Bacillota bacterium]|nr:FHA domain-containing protein [Bacillota bacterium]